MVIICLLWLETMEKNGETSQRVARPFFFLKSWKTFFFFFFFTVWILFVDTVNHSSSVKTYSFCLMKTKAYPLFNIYFYACVLMMSFSTDNALMTYLLALLCFAVSHKTMISTRLLNFPLTSFLGKSLSRMEKKKMKKPRKNNVFSARAEKGREYE